MNMNIARFEPDLKFLCSMFRINLTYIEQHLIEVVSIFKENMSNLRKTFCYVTFEPDGNDKILLITTLLLTGKGGFISYKN